MYLGFSHFDKEPGSIAFRMHGTSPLVLHLAGLLSLCTDLRIYGNHCLFQDWELLVLSKLKWDISSVVAVEFLDVLLDRLELSAERLVYTRSQALKYITLCCLGMYPSPHSYRSFPGIIVFIVQMYSRQ